MEQQALPLPQAAGQAQEQPAPRWIRIYDNGGRSFDRYFVVFTEKYRKKTGGQFIGLGMSEHPYHPQGFGQHSYSDRQFDWPAYGHLGKRITWDKLPPDCQRCVRQTYNDLWLPTSKNETG